MYQIYLYEYTRYISMNISKMFLLIYQIPAYEYICYDKSIWDAEFFINQLIIFVAQHTDKCKCWEMSFQTIFLFIYQVNFYWFTRYISIYDQSNEIWICCIYMADCQCWEMRCQTIFLQFQQARAPFHFDTSKYSPHLGFPNIKTYTQKFHIKTYQLKAYFLLGLSSYVLRTTSNSF